MQTGSCPTDNDRKHYQSVLVSQMGGLGDVVLTSQLIACLRQDFPNATVDLLCQKANAPVTELFPVQPSRTFGVDCEPRLWETSTERAAADCGELQTRLAGITSCITIAAEYRPCALSAVAASVTGAAKTLSTWPAFDSGIPSTAVYEIAAVDENAHVLERLNALGELAGAGRRGFPEWHLPDQVRSDAVAFLGAHDIEWKDYTVVFPFGSPGAELKRWPVERFAAVLNTLRSEKRRDLVLLGDPSERKGLEILASLLNGEGHIAIWSAPGADLNTACGLISGARDYLGNDTGPLHVAGAYCVPGVAIYGGGLWPAYQPWARGSIGVVQELPCFGCDWDCVLGRSLCVEAIPVDAVLDAMHSVDRRGVPAEPEVRHCQAVAPVVFPVLRDASRRFREVQADRLARYRAIVALENGLESCRTEAAERLAALEVEAAARRHIANESEERNWQIGELTRLIGIRDERIRELMAAEVESKRLAAESEQEQTQLQPVSAELHVSDGPQ